MILTGMVAAGVLLGGTSIVGASMGDKQEPVVINEKGHSEEVVKTKEDKKSNRFISYEEAKEIALAERDGYVDDIELERDHGSTYYEVEIENGDVDYDVYIDASTGEILAVDGDRDYFEYENKNKALENVMSADQAKQIALDTFGGKVVELDFDEDDGRFEYEIELRTKHGEAEMTIDAITGDILEQELDD